MPSHYPRELIGGSASQTRAHIARQEYQDYLRNYGPTEERLASMYRNPMLRQEAIADAGTFVRDAFGSMSGQRDRQIRGLGLELTPQQQESMQRQDQLSMSLADVTARNRAQRGFNDRDDLIAAGASTGLISGG